MVTVGGFVRREEMEVGNLERGREREGLKNVKG